MIEKEILEKELNLYQKRYKAMKIAGLTFVSLGGTWSLIHLIILILIMAPNVTIFDDCVSLFDIIALPIFAIFLLLFIGALLLVINHAFIRVKINNRKIRLEQIDNNESDKNN